MLIDIISLGTGTILPAPAFYAYSPNRWIRPSGANLQAILFLGDHVGEGIEAAGVALQVLDFCRGGLPGTRLQVSAELSNQRRIRAVCFGERSWLLA